MHPSPFADGPFGRERAAHFTLESHHLAVLDRFVARARRYARAKDSLHVVVQIDQTRTVSVHAVDLKSRVLNLGACSAGGRIQTSAREGINGQVSDK